MLRVAEQVQRTDTGRQRQANEDAYFARSPVFVVADGMGGAQAGEVAARIATDAFEAGNQRGEPPEAYLRGVAEDANRRIFELAGRDSSRSGMGTTLTAAMISADEISLAQVGDSRAYLLRDGMLKRLTSDHSLVEELRRQGKLTEQEANEHPQRSIITRALGPEPRVEVDTMTYRGRDGDIVLLCSDGLTTMVPESRIAEIVASSGELRAAAARMIREANEEGGRDNITVVAFRLEEVDVPSEDREEGGTAAGGATAEAPEPAPGPAASAEETAVTRPPPLEPLEETVVAAPPRTPRRRRRRLVGVAIGVAVVAALVVAAVLGARQIYFLGTDEAGRVALFRGLPYELPFDLRLYDERHSSPIGLDSLPSDRRDSVTDHELRSRDDAVDLIEDLERAAEQRGARPAKQ